MRKKPSKQKMKQKTNKEYNRFKATSFTASNGTMTLLKQQTMILKRCTS